MIRDALPRGRTLLVVLLLAVAVSIFVVALSRRDDTKKECVSQTFEGVVDTDRTADETLALFVAQHEEGPIPLTGWTKTVDSPAGTTFVSSQQGHWQIDIRNGAVRSYQGCPA